jgi:L-threonylcarbamoyladenylate synthase
MSVTLTTGLREAGDLIAGGGLVLYPTDTLYGMGGDATRPSVAARVLSIKGLTGIRPFPILVPSLEPAMEAAASRVRPILEALARTLWPGALTVVVPLSAASQALLAPAAPFGTAGFRMPAHPAARYLAARAGGYLIGTSANPARGAPPTDIEALDRDLVETTDACVAAAPPCGGLASTVLDITGDDPSILRAGDLDPELLSLLRDARP